ncbi:hypothetical protein ElyMa_001731700 [Elysia marginata]|uniref:Uncharacterized protein n=1 Tax=Elysia marginata TaxID=1093978 RepID=A0AAV4K0Y6_9GAST|nr:hypothetical protein ElyMa_001731700 [Elysia marginata]
MKHNTPSQGSRSCISEAVKSVAVLGSIDTLILWQNVLRIFILLSHLMSSSTSAVFSSLVDVFGRPDFGSSSRLVRPSPNQAHYLHTRDLDIAPSPYVSAICLRTSEGLILLENNKKKKEKHL